MTFGSPYSEAPASIVDATYDEALSAPPEMVLNHPAIPTPEMTLNHPAIPVAILPPNSWPQASLGAGPFLFNLLMPMSHMFL